RPHIRHGLGALDLGQFGRRQFHPMRVLARFFLGGSVRYEIGLEDGQRFPVVAPAHSGHAAGDTVSVALAR
ncbi:TOBE domain-containing protein, partial [Bordetella petrii]|uniref:TOBE domain-containing protein n=1 Tax=Bordetella petrii TaxID=94624 RepID=UPI001E3504D7